jgi:hypothetical protein
LTSWLRLEGFILGEGYSEKDLRKFQNALRKSNTDSIDAFLETRKEFLEIGKFCIACKLHRFEDTARINYSNETWLRYLWNKMHSPKNQFVGNNIKIVTFNYDRLLEHYLFTSILNKFGTSFGETKRLLSNIEILHFHGRLAELSWEKEDGIKYGFNPDDLESHYRFVKKSVDNIKIISEDINMHLFEIARQYINENQQVFFLGFGFHPLNLGSCI